MSSPRSARSSSRSKSIIANQVSTQVVSDEDFCRNLADEIIEKILEDQLEKYHHEEVIPWTVDHIGELLKEVLDFAFVDTDAGLDLQVDSFFLDEMLVDPQNQVDEPLDASQVAMSELMEHRFADISWQEDSEDAIPVAPMDSWGTASIPVTQIIYVDCEEGEAKEEEEVKEGEKTEEGERLTGGDANKKRRKKKAKKEEPRPVTGAHEEASVAVAEDPLVDETSKIPIYVPHPLQRHPYPWVGLSKKKKKTQRQNHRSPSKGRQPAARGEGRGLGQQAACTCQKLCPSVIFRHLPHTTQSDLRAHYLRDPQDPTDVSAPQCEACFGKPEIAPEDIEVGDGAVFLEKERLSPEKMASRFVDCGVKIPAIRRPKDAIAGKDDKKQVKKPTGASRKKALPRLSLDGAIVDDPKDPLHGSRLIANITLCPGVNVKAGEEQLIGPPFPHFTAALKPENRAFFAAFNFDQRNELSSVKSQHSNKFLTKDGSPRAKVSLPKLRPYVNQFEEREEEERVFDV